MVNRVTSLIILITGVALMILGFVVSDSISSDVSRIYTGAPTDKSLWLLISGAVAVLLGSSGILWGPKTP